MNVLPISNVHNENSHEDGRAITKHSNLALESSSRVTHKGTIGFRVLATNSGPGNSVNCLVKKHQWEEVGYFD